MRCFSRRGRGEICAVIPQPFYFAEKSVARNCHRLTRAKKSAYAISGLEGQGNSEIADSMNTSLATVKRKLKKIREIWLVR